MCVVTKYVIICLLIFYRFSCSSFILFRSLPSSPLSFRDKAQQNQKKNILIRSVSFCSFVSVQITIKVLSFLIGFKITCQIVLAALLSFYSFLSLFSLFSVIFREKKTKRDKSKQTKI